MLLLILLSCKQTVRRMNDYLDRELTAREMKWVKSHLAICHACATRFAFEDKWTQALRDKLDRAATADPSPELATKVAAALQLSAPVADKSNE